MLVGAGGNMAVQFGQDGVLLVDAQYAALSDKILAEIRKLSDGPIRYIVNTHVHEDHTDGNERLRAAGSTIPLGTLASPPGATLVAHENVLKRMSSPTAAEARAREGALPTATFPDEEKKLFFNNEGISIVHLPSAHTDGDVIVFFRRSDVISTGDLFTTTAYPVIDLVRGGSIQGFIDGLNRILDLVISARGQEGGTMIIPGHGRLCDAGDLINYRDMATIIRDRIQDMIKKGMTLEQVRAAKPTFDYDPLYGGNPDWTPDMFVEAAYTSLTKK